MHEGIKSLPRPGMGVLGINQQYFTFPATKTTINGVINIGDGPWDNSTTAFNNAFVNGNVILAINTVAGYGSGAPAFDRASNGSVILGLADKGRFRWAVFWEGHTQLTSGSLSKNAHAIGGQVMTITSAVLGSGGSLVVGTTYFYKVTWFDVLGRESPLTTGQPFATPTTGNQTITVTWSAPTNTGQSYYRVYRTTTSGVYTNSNYYVLDGTQLTFVDIGQAPSGTGTPNQNLAPSKTASAPGYAPWPFDAATPIQISSNTGQPSYIQQLQAGATTRPRCLYLGSGPCDGTTGGFYSGNANTIFAINSYSGFTGNLCDFQVAGVQKMKLDSTGVVTISSALIDGVGTNATARVGCYYNFS